MSRSIRGSHTQLQGGIFDPGIALLLFVCAVTALKLVLANPMLVQARPDQYLDDMLFLDLGQYFAQGNWLGPFSERTLAKGPVYSIFVGLNLLSGFPLKLTEQILYLLASYFFASSAGRAAGSRMVTALVFAALAFNPASTMAEVAYVLREGIYTSLALLVLGCAIRGSMAVADGEPKSSVFWGGCFGLAFATTWLTREEGIWLVPALTLLLLAAAALGRENLAATRRWKSAAAALGSTILAFALVVGWVSAINWAKYGVFAVNDYRSGPFARAYGALQRIMQDRPISYIPIPNSSLTNAFDASTTLASIRPAFEREQAFRQESCRHYPDACGEIAGGWISWALRTAAAQSGIYAEAGTAQAFWDRVSAEINSACETGKLRCEEPHGSLTPPVSRWPLERLPASFLHGLRVLLTMGDVSPQPRPSYGELTQIKLIESVVNQPATPPKSGLAVVTVDGWMVPLGVPPPSFVLVGNDRTSSAVIPQWYPSPDLAAIFGDRPGADKARFSFRGSCQAPCRLRVEEGGTLRHDVPLEAHTRPLIVGENSSGILAFDRVLTSLEATGASAVAREMKILVLKWVARGYSLALPVLVPLAFLGFAAALAFGRSGTATGRVLVLLTALGVAVVTRLALLTVVHETSFPALYCLYIAPAYPLLIAFTCISIFLGFDTLRRRFTGLSA